MFGLESGLRVTTCAPPFLRGNYLALANARSGIRILADALNPGAVWMPAFLCDVMLAAVPKQTPVRFYGITRDLRVASTAWLQEVQPGDLVLLIDYFGFPCDTGICHAARRRGARVVEDACQGLLSAHVGANADFILFSPRKTLAVPDGGVLVIRNCDDWPRIQLQPAPAAWVLKSIEAFVLRREFDLYGGERRFFQLFRELDEEGPIGPYTMSGLAQLLLEESFDYPAIARRRRENYQTLAAHLGDAAIFPELPDDVVPLGFPIRIPRRDRVRQALFRHEIYPPVHWPMPEQVPSEFTDSHRLVQEIMTLVCDQRYTGADMERTSTIILEHIDRSAAAPK